MPVLVAPEAFCKDLRAPVVAAAIGRGLERAGCVPPELCPLACGGPGTIELLLPALGGQTADGFALIEDGGTALVELDPDAALTGERLAAAAATGAAVVMLAAAGVPRGDAGVLLEALGDHGGLRGAALVVLCDVREPGATALALRDGRVAARLVAGVPFVLEALDFDARMRAAHALVAGERLLDRGTLRGRVAGEIAVRARQAGVPCHAVVGKRAIDRFDTRILDLQAILEAGTVAELENAGEQLAAYL